MQKKQRCSWLPLSKEDYVTYHDTEWGKPNHNDRDLFECLMLEGAQAGLSWYTVLTKREGYRKVFKNFDARKIVSMKDEELETILANGPIIKNKLKVYAVRKNAEVFLRIQQEFGSFDTYLWNFVHNTPIVHKPKSPKDIKGEIPESVALAKDLKKRGMTFVGGSITYAFMQAVGMINDHTQECFLCKN